MFCRITISLVALLAFEQAAAAQWIYQEKNSAFGDASVQLALTMAPDGQALGLRCEQGDLTVVFVTSENGDDPSSINALSPKILLRPDKGPIMKLNGRAAIIKGRLTFVAKVDGKKADALRDARDRIAVAMEMLGRRFHETAVDAAGASQVTQKVISSCATVTDVR